MIAAPLRALKDGPVRLRVLTMPPNPPPRVATFGAQRDNARKLTTAELERLAANGFPEVARRLAAGTCPRCGLNRAGQGHRDLCVTPAERRKPLKAAPEPAQPWDVKPPRHLRAAA